MKQTLSFSITGEFITCTAREWFWEENKPYEICEQLLFSCLVNDQITDEQRRLLAQDIIEGRKKLVGINDLTIEDDNKNVRPLSQKVNELKRKNGVLQIMEDMRINPIKYVDPYSSVKSIKAIKDGLTRFSVYVLEDVIHYFTHFEDYYGVTTDKLIPQAETPTACGLWLFDEASLIYDICYKLSTTVGTDDFWDAVYQNTKDRDGFQERNNRYLAKQRLIKRNSDEQQNPEKYGVYDSTREIRHDDEKIKPDNINKWAGLISPKGDFYSCGFAEHTRTAYLIIVHNPTMFPNEMKYVGKSNIEYMPRFDLPDSALDILINDYGWCATRYLPTEGDYITFPSNKKITKAQKDTIWDAILKFDKHIKINEILM